MLLQGGGLPLVESHRQRDEALDFQRGAITVRQGNVAKHRVTTIPRAVGVKLGPFPVCDIPNFVGGEPNGSS